ncbi:MAG: hypothetical protein ACREN3_15275, partial [Gemmatimonadaceae bacterium]
RMPHRVEHFGPHFGGPRQEESFVGHHRTDAGFEGRSPAVPGRRFARELLVTIKVSPASNRSSPAGL